MDQMRNPASMTRLPLALALALVATSGLHGQVTPATERIRAGLPDQQARAVEALLERAREQNLPVQPLVDKALEGIAKRAPAPLVVQALERLSNRLGQARAILLDGEPPAGPDVAAVADALGRGVPENAVRSLRARRGPGEPIGLAVHTLGDLLDRDVPVDRALDVLEAWRERGARADALRQLPAAVEGLIRRGVMPGEAAAAVAATVRAGMPAATASPGHMPGKAKGHGPGGMSAQPPIPPGAGPPSTRPSHSGPHKPGGPPPS